MDSAGSLISNADSKSGNRTLMYVDISLGFYSYRSPIRINRRQDDNEGFNRQRDRKWIIEATVSLFSWSHIAFIYIYICCN